MRWSRGGEIGTRGRRRRPRGEGYARTMPRDVPGGVPIDLEGHIGHRASLGKNPTFFARIRYWIQNISNGRRRCRGRHPVFLFPVQIGIPVTTANTTSGLWRVLAPRVHCNSICIEYFAILRQIIRNHQKSLARGGGNPIQIPMWYCGIGGRHRTQ